MYARLLSTSLLLILCSCSMFDSGGQVRAAREQSDLHTIDKDGMQLDAAGTHGKSVFYAEGTQLNGTFDKDGNVIPDVETSTFTKMYWTKPEVQGITDIYQQQALIASQQTQATLDFGTAIINAFAPIVAARGGTASPQPTDDRLDRLESLVARLLVQIDPDGQTDDEDSTEDDE